MKLYNNKSDNPPDGKRLLDLLENSTAGIIIYECPGGQISFANKKAHAILGNVFFSSEKQVHEKSGMFKTDGTAYGPGESPVSGCMRTGEAVSGEEVLYISPDGKKSFLSLNISPHFSPDGKVENLMCVFEDITCKKARENLLDNNNSVLSETEEKFSKIFHNNPAAIIINTINDGKIIEANEKVSEIFGYSRRELTETQFSTKQLYSNPADRERMISLLRKNGKVQDFETIGVDSLGRKKNLLISTEILNFKDRDYLIGSLLDITAIKESEERFYKIFHNNPAAISISRMTDGVLVDVNETFLDIFGYSRDELIGRSSGELGMYINLSDREFIVNGLQEHGMIMNCEMNARKKNGSILTLLLSAVRINFKGEDQILFSTIDITGKKKAEEAVRKSQAKLEKLNAALQQAKENLEIKVEERTSRLQKTLKELDAERQRVTGVLNILPVYVAVYSKDHKVIFSNKVYEQEFGDIANRLGYDYITEDRKCEDCKLDRVFRTKQPVFWEWNAPNGKIYDVSDFLFRDGDGNDQILEMGLDITEKKNFEHYVLKKVVETEERDRRQFASDLHDDLGPTLSAIKLQLSMLSNEYGNDSKSEVFRICDDLLSEGIEKMKNVANNILPNILERYGLETAARSFMNRVLNDTHIGFRITSNLEGFRFDSETELHLYRIITELITNTIRHSGGNEILLVLKLTNHEFEMVYSDNGKTYSIETDPHKITGVGLQNIQNRTSLINGLLDINTRSNRTRVTIKISGI